MKKNLYLTRGIKAKIFCFLFFLLLVWGVSPANAVADKLPGALPFGKDLVKKMNKFLETRGKETPPRTRHLDSRGNPKFSNRLFLESSPYLRQHAHNPVNWYPWGKEAFETAKKLNRPILLSIGYSTCHWCHVMEEESFEDLEIAKFINENYVAIKVDREERPDIDSIYMKALMALEGSGGWPMTMFITQDKKPFYGGTYFPARDGDRGGSIGFLTLLKKLNELYQKDRARIETAGDAIAAYLEKTTSSQASELPPLEKLIQKNIKWSKKGFDWQNGGIIGRNKFPSSLPFGFLLRRYSDSKSVDSKDDEVLKMVTLTLDKMMAGGFHDQAGGGFHRYATDSIWKVPHYEKMLYDNALLSIAYTEAYQATGNEAYKKTAQKTLDYLLREMQSPGGGFYAATDADSLNNDGKKEEGYFFTWTAKEMDLLFDPKTADIVKTYYGILSTPGRRQVLHVTGSKKELAQRAGISSETLEQIIEAANRILYTQRSKRPPPGRDEKIILSWNSLVISALAKAGFAFDAPRYIAQAKKTETFIRKYLWQDQTLFHSVKDQLPGHDGFLSDYAFLTAAYLDLFDATSDLIWLQNAMALDDIILQKFEDREQGGFFMTPIGQGDLIVREKPMEDGALPSGNAVTINNLARLFAYTGQDNYQKRAKKAMAWFAGDLAATPEYMPGMVSAMAALAGPAREYMVITPANERFKAKPFLDILRRAFQPHVVLVTIQEGEQLLAASKIIPYLLGRKAINGMATVYPCEDRVCRLPLTNPADLAALLDPP